MRRARDLLRRYGLTIAQWDQMVADQKGRCWICRLEFGTGGYRPCVDHNHDPPYTVRGILCDHCNRGLGCFHDRVKSLRRAIKYLKQLGGANDNE